ncbi:MAG: hypothetical protein ACRCXA_12740 [Peptostreptococcaceae bacterium]
MVNFKKVSNKKMLVTFILLILFGMCMNFLSAYDFIGPSINITQEAPEEEGMLTEEVKLELLEIASAYQDPYMAWRFGTYIYYELVCIVLACCAMFYPCVIDIKNGNLLSALSTKDRILYFKKCYIKNFFRGGLVVILPTIIATIIYFIIFDSTSFPSNIVEPMFPQNILSNLFVTDPFKYMLFYTFILFFIGATYSTFGLAVSIYSKRILFGMIVPFIYWYGGSVIIGSILGLTAFEPWNIFYFIVDATIPFGISFIHTLIILALSSFMIYKKIVINNK